MGLWLRSNTQVRGCLLKRVKEKYANEVYLLLSHGMVFILLVQETRICIGLRRLWCYVLFSCYGGPFKEWPTHDPMLVVETVIIGCVLIYLVYGQNFWHLGVVCFWRYKMSFVFFHVCRRRCGPKVFFHVFVLRKKIICGVMKTEAWVFFSVIECWEKKGEIEELEKKSRTKIPKKAKRKKLCLLEKDLKKTFSGILSSRKQTAFLINVYSPADVLEEKDFPKKNKHPLSQCSDLSYMSC